ncbi:MAG: hypothetical protein QXI16_03420 [Sulfolobaceae archaeon]
MLLSDYLNEVQRYVPASINLPVATIVNAINSARRKLALDTGCMNQIYSFNLTAGTSQYSFPSVNGLKIYNVLNVWAYLGTIRYKLKKRRMGFNPIQNIKSFPTDWWEQQQSVIYFPIPSYPYQTEWEIFTNLILLVNPTDVETIPLIYHEAVTYLAARQVALATGNVPLAQVYQGEYISLLTAIKSYRY